MPNDIAILRSRLRCFRGRYPEVSQVSGLSTSWISKFANEKRGKRPSFTTVNALEKAIMELECSATPAKKALDTKREVGSVPSQSLGPAPERTDHEEV